ncbi:MAG: hypothetical protein II184_06605 [Clostridia bacterium]|nr:hypothetical protein [Clostridia bacterium]
MPYTEASKRATIKYQKENLEQLIIRLPIGERQRIKDHAQLMGDNMTAFLRRAINETIQRDREKIQARMKGE